MTSVVDPVEQAAATGTLDGPPGSATSQSREPSLHLDRRQFEPSPLAAVVVIVVAVVSRVAVRSAMWLDEAQTVAIARVPLLSLGGALRHDGAPPLYYAALHVWMRVVGTSTPAVRALPELFGVAAIPAMWRLARRIGSREMAWTATALFATSPFAVRYSSENRMYSLVVLLVLLGAIAVLDALRSPTRHATAKVAVVTALLLYTHYWAIFLVSATALLLAWQWWRLPERRRATAVPLRGVVMGAALFVPWLPVFAWQSLHTSTPWSVAPTFAAMASAVGDYSGGDTSAGWALGLLLFALVVVGVFGRRGPGHIVVELRPQPSARPWAAIVIFTAAVALVATMVSGSAIAPRYTSVIFGFWLVLAAFGVHTIPERRARVGVVAGLVVLGVVASFGVDGQSRTQAAQVAKAIRRHAQPGDIVAYCPDQLGPAVSRLLPGGLMQYTYPRWSSPQQVDWVDYQARMAAQRPGAFAGALAALASNRTVWLVWSDGYRGAMDACTQLRSELTQLRGTPTTVVQASTQSYERASLFAFG